MSTLMRTYPAHRNTDISLGLAQPCLARLHGEEQATSNAACAANSPFAQNGSAFSLSLVPSRESIHNQQLTFALNQAAMVPTASPSRLASRVRDLDARQHYHKDWFGNPITEVAASQQCTRPVDCTPSWPSVAAAAGADAAVDAADFCEDPFPLCRSQMASAMSLPSQLAALMQPSLPTSHSRLSATSSSSGGSGTAANRPKLPIVIVWDLDETLIVFNTLLNGSYAKTVPGTDAEAARALGEELATLVFDFCDKHMLFNLVDRLDPVHMLDVKEVPGGAGTGPREFGMRPVIPAAMAAAIAAGTNNSCGLSIVEPSLKRCRTAEMGLAGGSLTHPLPHSPSQERLQTMTAALEACAQHEKRQHQRAYDRAWAVYLAGHGALPLTDAEWAHARGLRAQVESLTKGWLAAAESLLRAVTAVAQEAGTTVHHCLVTSGQLVATLGKLLLFQLDDLFDVGNIYSASQDPKLSCFRRIAQRFGPGFQYLAVGDGVEEERAAALMSWPFVRVVLASEPPMLPGNSAHRVCSQGGDRPGSNGSFSNTACRWGNSGTASAAQDHGASPFTGASLQGTGSNGRSMDHASSSGAGGFPDPFQADTAAGRLPGLTIPFSGTGALPSVHGNAGGECTTAACNAGAGAASQMFGHPTAANQASQRDLASSTGPHDLDISVNDSQSSFYAISRAQPAGVRTQPGLRPAAQLPAPSPVNNNISNCHGMPGSASIHPTWPATALPPQPIALLPAATAAPALHLSSSTSVPFSSGAPLIGAGPGPPPAAMGSASFPPACMLPPPQHPERLPCYGGSRSALRAVVRSPGYLIHELSAPVLLQLAMGQ